MVLRPRRLVLTVLSLLALVLGALAPATAAEVEPTQTGLLTGTVSFADGSHPADAWVTVYDEQGSDAVARPRYEPETGRWEADLPEGTYKVEVWTEGAGWWAAGTQSPENADRYAVTVGSTTHADLTMPNPSGVAGTVTDGRTGDPVAGVCVTVATEGDWGPMSCTDASGAYRVTGVPAGSWPVMFDDESDRFAVVWSGGAATRESAAKVNVTEGALTAVDMALAPGAVLSGRAVDRLGRPVADACPAAYAGRGAWIRGQGSTCSGADGLWRVAGLPATTVTVELNHRSFAPTWAYGTSEQAKAKVFTVQSGATTTTKDVELLTGVTFRGIVRDAVTQLPLKGMTVELDGYAPRAGGTVSPWHATTDDTGLFVITGVPAGTYRPVAYDRTGDYAVQWAGRATERSAGTTYTVKGNQEVLLGFALSAGATVTGTLDPNPGLYLGSDILSALDGGMLGYGTDVNAETGEFTIRGLPATSVVLRFTDFETGREFFHGGDTRESATVLTLEAGETRTVTARPSSTP